MPASGTVASAGRPQTLRSGDRKTARRRRNCRTGRTRWSSWMKGPARPGAAVERSFCSSRQTGRANSRSWLPSHGPGAAITRPPPPPPPPPPVLSAHVSGSGCQRRHTARYRRSGEGGGGRVKTVATWTRPRVVGYQGRIQGEKLPLPTVVNFSIKSMELRGKKRLERFGPLQKRHLAPSKIVIPRYTAFVEYRVTGISVCFYWLFLKNSASRYLL